MEDLAFKQNGEHPGRSFCTSHNYLATVGKVSVSTVKRVCNYFEEIGLLTVTNRKTSGCRFDLNLYTLKYPKLSVAPTKLRLRSSTKPTLNKLDIQRGMASMPPVPSRLVPRGIDAMPKKEQSEAVDPVAEAKLAAEQLAAAKERRRQEEAELAERQERERIEKEQRLERLRQAEEKRKADEEAAKLAEDTRRLAMKTDVAACRWAIINATFDEWDYGSLGFDVLHQFDRRTLDAAVDKLLPDFPSVFNKIKALIKNCPWEFD